MGGIEKTGNWSRNHHLVKNCVSVSESDTEEEMETRTEKQKDATLKHLEVKGLEIL